MYNGLSADVPFSVFSVLIHSLMLHFPRVTSYIFFGVALFRAALFSVSIPFKFYLFHIALFWSSTFLCCTFFMFWIFPVVIFSDFFFFSDWTFPCCSVLCCIVLVLHIFHVAFFPASLSKSNKGSCFVILYKIWQMHLSKKTSVELVLHQNQKYSKTVNLFCWR